MTLRFAPLFLTVVISFFSNLFGQTGPGGLGNTVNNALWIKADAGTNTTTNGANITFWNDQSGNNINFTQTVVNQQPRFYSGLMNGYPAIDFDNVNTAGQNDFLTALDHPALDNTNGYSFFTVTRMRSSSGSARSIISKRVNVGAEQAFMLFFYTSNRFHIDIDNMNDRFGLPSAHPINTNKMLNVFYDGTLPTASRVTVWDGESLEMTSAETSNFVPDKNSPVLLGTTHNGDTRAFDGYISEVIVYREKLNKASRIIVNNYLSAKYDIPLTTRDYYWGDNPVNGNYDYDVAGIGKDTIMPGAIIGSNNVFATTSCAGIGLSIVSSASLDVGDYLLAGHRTPVNSDNYTDVAGIPGTYPSRWERIWQVSITNTGPNINANIVFDMSDAGMTPNLTGAVTANYVLVYRPGLTGAWTVVATANNLVGDRVSFDNFTFVNSGYYTLATQNFNASPLPIELLSFDVQNISNEHVQLDWATATEINNDYFVVQKTIDNQIWNDVLKVNGMMNSQTTTYYTHYDYRPYSGTSYYRLKQVNTDGNFNYSSIRSVVFDIPNNIVLFPNPVTDILSISATLEKNAHIINSLGQKVVDYVELITVGDDLYQVNINHLKEGIYFFVNGNEKYKLVKSR